MFVCFYANTMLYLISSQYELDNRRSMWGRVSTVGSQAHSCKSGQMGLGT